MYTSRLLVLGQKPWHVARNGNSVIKYWCPKFTPLFWSWKDPACCSRSLIGVVSWSNMELMVIFLEWFGWTMILLFSNMVLWYFMCWYCSLCHLGSLQDIYRRYESFCTESLGLILSHGRKSQWRLYPLVEFSHSRSNQWVNLNPPGTGSQKVSASLARNVQDRFELCSLLLVYRPFIYA